MGDAVVDEVRAPGLDIGRTFPCLVGTAPAVPALSGGCSVSHPVSGQHHDMRQAPINAK
jgi:hypothetical protein